MRFAILAALAAAAFGQDIHGYLSREGARLPSLAVPDYRGAGAADGLVQAFNRVVEEDLDDCGLVKLGAKTSFPKFIPQTLNENWRTADWAMAPASVNYLALGYAAAVGDQFVFYGWMVDVRQATPQAGKLVEGRYNGALTAAGARHAGHEFAAEMIRSLGGKPLVGTTVYFRSDRSGEDQIWGMDWDGENQRQVTRVQANLKLGGTYPAVSMDGRKLAFLSFRPMQSHVQTMDLDSGRVVPFPASEKGQFAPSFTPDGKQILFAWPTDIYVAQSDGSHPIRVTSGASVDTEPKVNPKGSDVVFVSDRAGKKQLYLTDLDGGRATALTSGPGEAFNPSWHPTAQFIAYACTRGELTGYHICIIEVATQKVTEIEATWDKDENPVWAPDGVHLVYATTRGGKSQIWTMLVDGTHRRQLTTVGKNQTPVWSVR